jgi:O-antigen/teichoic acid export membrane protein
VSEEQGERTPGVIPAVMIEQVVNVGDLEVAEAVGSAESDYVLPPNLGRSVVIDYASTAAAMISGLLVTPILLDKLGKQAFGIWSLASVVVFYLGALDLGFGRATTKLVAEDAGRRQERVHVTINTSFFVLAVFGCFALLIALGIAMASPQLFSVPHGMETESRLVFGILGVAVALALPGGALGGALVGYKRYDLFAVTVLASVVLTGIVTIGFALAGVGIVAIAAAVAIITLTMEVARFVMMRRLVPNLRLRPKFVHRAQLRSTASLSAWFIARDVGLLIMTRIDLVVVGLELNVTEVAIFAVGLKLAQVAQATQTPLQAIFMPHAADLDRNADPSQLRALLVQGTRITLLAAVPVSIVLVLLSENIVNLWVGDGYHTAAIVLIYLGIAGGLGALTSTAWQILAGMGKVKLSAGIANFEAAVNLAASLILGHMMGPAGVALGTLIGVALVDLPVVIGLSLRSTGLPLGTFIRGVVVPHLFPIAVAGFLVFAGSLVGTSLAVTALTAIVAVGAYVALYLRWGATDDERHQASRAFHKLRRLLPAA